MNPFVYCAYKLVVVRDVTLGLTDSTIKMMQSNKNKMLLSTIKHCIERPKH